MRPFFICGGGYTHYFLISGQDFPLKPIEEIVEFLKVHEDDNFIECSKIKTFEKRNDISFSRMVVGRNTWQKVLKNILVYGTGGWSHTFSIMKRSAPNNFHYFFGSSWWCLNNKTVMWIEAYIQQHPEFQSFFERSLCADECFFQTLVMNSLYVDSVKPYLHFVKFEHEESSPVLLTIDNYSELQKSGKMIARKFDLKVDAAIVKKLCRIIKINYNAEAEEKCDGRGMLYNYSNKQ